MQRRTTRMYFTVMLMLLMFSAPLTAQKKDHDKDNDKDKERGNAANLPAVIWRDPGDIASLNLLYGAGGKEHAPDPNGQFVFVKEDMKGTSPKFDVKDDQGVEWKVKLGQEPQSETAATRLMWAAGYFVDEDYYLEQFKVTGMPKLRRGGKFVSPNGTVHAARLKRKVKGTKKLGTWDWFHNPFLDRQEFNGLRAMMALLNNWDLKEINNAIEETEGERRYMVTDLGATFGKTGGPSARSKSELQDYENSKFVEKAKPEYVDLVMNSRPFVMSAINVPNYQARSRMESITKHIPRADAKWLAQRLSQLSEEQIRDGFRAAGYTPEEVEGYTKAVQERIAELNTL
jgi:hypothetical protein